METLKLEIVTPYGMIFSGDVKSVTLPGSEGEFGVLPRHAALVSLLKAGVIEIEKVDGSIDSIAISWGHAKIDESKAVILAEGAVAIAGRTESEMAKAIEEAKELIKKSSSEDYKAVLANTEAKIEKAAKKIL